MTFPTAAEARAGSRNNLAIHAEIRDVEELIYQAISEGKLGVDVTTSSFTKSVIVDPEGPANPEGVDPIDYFYALFDDAGVRSAHEVLFRSLREQIDLVRKNFRDLGYQITPVKNTSAGNRFMWRILW
jgi:hypothetical protein